MKLIKVHPQRRGFRTWAYITGVFGLLWLCYFLLYMFPKMSQFLEQGREASARVIAWEVEGQDGSDTQPTYYLTVSFEDTQKKTIRARFQVMEYDLYKNLAAFGRETQVLYLPDEPTEAILKQEAQDYPFGLEFLIPLLLTLLGLGLFIYSSQAI